MATSKTFSEIAEHIRVKVVYEGLELEDIGIDLADVTDDVRLFDEDGLNLDSIDALEVIAGVQREFGLSLPGRGRRVHRGALRHGGAARQNGTGPRRRDAGGRLSLARSEG